MTIVEFATARLGEREQRARNAEDAVGTKYDPIVASKAETMNIGLYELYESQHPARALRTVAAGRRILARHADDGHGSCEGCACEYADISLRYAINDCPELRDLVAPDDDHPDFNPAWRVA